MAEPRTQVGDGGANVGGPVGVEILVLKPGKDGRELVGSGRERQAVGEVEAPVAKSEELGAKEVLAAEGEEVERPAGEAGLETPLPAGLELPGEGCGTVVEPVVGERLAGSAHLGGEGAGSDPDLGRKLRIQDVAISRGAKHNAEQIEGCTADDDAVEEESPPGEVVIKGGESIAGHHGYQYNRYAAQAALEGPPVPPASARHCPPQNGNASDGHSAV
jgi:hypothetical protein